MMHGQKNIKLSSCGFHKRLI